MVEQTVVVRAAPAFELSVAADREPVAPGGELTYTATWGYVAAGRAAQGVRLLLKPPCASG